MTTLFVDSREPEVVKSKFQLLAEDNKDLTVEVKALKTGDFLNPYLVIERKSIDDFISSFTTRKTRQDGTTYERLDSQVKRLLDMEQPTKVILIHGNLSDAYSNIHPNSVNGQIASLMCQGLIVYRIPGDEDWTDAVLRLHRKSLKYGPARIKGVLK